MKRTALALFVICAGLFCGCSANELEENCFPMLAIADLAEDEGQVAFGYAFPDTGSGESEEYTQEEKAEEIDSLFVYGADFAEAMCNYEQRLNKVTDCNHLKVLVISESLFEQQEQYEAMLDFLAEEEKFPRNAYVCIVPDAAALMELDGGLSDDLGSYLEDYLLNHENKKERRLVTVGKLMDESRNHLLTLYLPYIEVENGSLLWTRWEALTYTE